ncbi:hypothetical protein ACJIZ3_017094 [Penstemon smallii]|uniref:CCT domain-containing protein n=1 Tax=Penstemon smallii TaxID=265156 RepID=A0ABD3SVU9_9LAMI
MFHNMVHPDQEQLPVEEMSSPIEAQLLDFCDSELFPPETLQNNSEIASSSNCCYDQEHSSSYPTNFSITTDMNKYNNNITENEIRNHVITARNNNNNMSIIFDPTEDQIENDVISASIDFTSSPSFSIPHHQYNQEPLLNISSLNNNPTGGVVPIIGPSTTFEEECGISSSMPSSYIRLRNTSHACALMDPMIAPYLPTTTNMSSAVPFCAESLMLGSNDFSHHEELDFQGDNAGLFLPDNMQRVFNCSNDLVHGGGGGAISSSSTPPPLASEISSLDDPTFKVGKLSPEERKRKILRYMKKRNERNFSKKIKYACRKTLADSRPRVRGRFAKNDELLLGGDQIACTTATGTNHEYDIDEDHVTLYSNPVPDHQHKVVVKEEEDLDSSDIFAHISGVNSFKCNYPIQSWI